MKILHINVNYGRGGGGGTEQSIPNTCRLLEERGHVTSVLYSQNTGEPDVVPGQPSVTRHLCHVPGICDHSLRPQREALGRALTFIASENPDVVHVHQTNNHHLMHEVMRRWPTLYFVHNHILTCPSGARLFKRTARVCNRQPGAMCLLNAYTQRCNSRRPARVLASYLGCFDARAFARQASLLAVDSAFMKDTLVASGYDPAHITIAPTVTELPELRESLPAPEPGTILYVGQITEEKGLAVLLRALRFVRAVEWRLVVAGKGYAERAARNLARELGLDDRVEFRGWVGRPDLTALYLRASVIAVPTIYPEPLGLVGPEAMAHARPVVAFDVGGVRQWLRDGVNGLLVPPGDIGAFAEALERLLQEPATAAALGQAGRKIMTQEFDPQQHVDVLLRLYAQAKYSFQQRGSYAYSLRPEPS